MAALLRLKNNSNIFLTMSFIWFTYLLKQSKTHDNSYHNKAPFYWLWRESPHFSTWHLGALLFLYPTQNHHFHMVSTSSNNHPTTRGNLSITPTHRCPPLYFCLFCCLSSEYSSLIPSFTGFCSYFEPSFTWPAQSNLEE